MAALPVTRDTTLAHPGAGAGAGRLGLPVGGTATVTALVEGGDGRLRTPGGGVEVSDVPGVEK